MHFILTAYCFVSALSIALSQIFLFAAIFYWVIFQITKPNNIRNQTSVRELAAPIGAFFLASFISSVGGLAPLHSISSILKTGLIFLVPFAVHTSLTCLQSTEEAFTAKLKLYFIAFVVGQSFAAIHTILTVILGQELPLHIPGALTESGQLVLVIPLAVCLFFLNTNGSGNVRIRRAMVLSIGALALTIVAAWPQLILARFNATALQLPALIVATLMIIVGLLNEKRKSLLSSRTFPWLVGTLLVAALIINLKRGPWFGVISELCVLGFFFSRNLMYRTLIIASLALITLSPVQTRLSEYMRDFSITGGRKNMWSLGAELVQKFPLGVGFQNARYMRELEPSLPETHRHMHNNLLNVAVESGWLGLGCYLWWMFAALKLGFGGAFSLRPERKFSVRDTISVSLAAALLGWQLAGIVEYNFGDSEIRLIGLFYMGLLLAIHTRNSQEFVSES